MIDAALIQSVVRLRPFAPAKDFEFGKHLCRDLGFTIDSDRRGLLEPDGDGVSACVESVAGLVEYDGYRETP